MRPELGEVWEHQRAVILIVATDSERRGWSGMTIIGLILHDDDDVWEVGDTLNFSDAELQQESTMRIA